MFSPLIRVAAGRSAEPSQALPSEPWHPVRNSGTKTGGGPSPATTSRFRSRRASCGVCRRDNQGRIVQAHHAAVTEDCVHGAVGPMDDAMRQALVEPAALIESRSAAVLDHALLAGELWTRALGAARVGSHRLALKRMHRPGLSRPQRQNRCSAPYRTQRRKKSTPPSVVSRSRQHSGSQKKVAPSMRRCRLSSRDSQPRASVSEKD